METNLIISIGISATEVGFDFISKTIFSTSTGVDGVKKWVFWLYPCKHEMHESCKKYVRKSKNMQEIHWYTSWSKKIWNLVVLGQCQLYTIDFTAKSYKNCLLEFSNYFQANFFLVKKCKNLPIILQSNSI